MLGLALLCSSPAGACATGLEGESARRVVVDGMTLIFRLDPPEILLGEPFGIDLAACDATGRRLDILRVDAQMPEHRHGMNYEPTLHPGAGGSIRADGLLFHMPGRWQFSFEVRDGAATRHLAADYLLE